ncbi:hypothetical protein HOD08_01430, partial [bacterium]|nr:hypothetical protein [bacterium]
GVLESAVDTASFFIPKGSKVVITKDNKGKIVQEYKTQSNPTLKRPVPIFLLINNFTASASEIVAGALRHYSNEAGNDAKSPLRVFIVGTTTFGKGSVQEIIPLSNGCALKQTSLMYFLPDHTSIQAKGIEPDFLIKPKITPTKEMKWVSELYGKETSLKHHVTAEEIEKNAKGESAGYAHEIDQTTMKKQAEEKAKQEKEKDDKEKYDKDKAKKKRLEDIATNPQIQACVNMISMLDLAKTAQPEDVSTRKKSLEFLKAHYLTDTPTEIEEIK